MSPKVSVIFFAGCILLQIALVLMGCIYVKLGSIGWGLSMAILGALALPLNIINLLRAAKYL